MPHDLKKKDFELCGLLSQELLQLQFLFIMSNHFTAVAYMMYNFMNTVFCSDTVLFFHKSEDILKMHKQKNYPIICQ